MTDANEPDYEPPELNRYGDLEEMTKGMGKTGMDNMSQRQGNPGQNMM